MFLPKGRGVWSLEEGGTRKGHGEHLLCKGSERGQGEGGGERTMACHKRLPVNKEIRGGFMLRPEREENFQRKNESVKKANSKNSDMVV